MARALFLSLSWFCHFGCCLPISSSCSWWISWRTRNFCERQTQKSQKSLQLMPNTLAVAPPTITERRVHWIGLRLFAATRGPNQNLCPESTITRIHSFDSMHWDRIHCCGASAFEFASRFNFVLFLESWWWQMVNLQWSLVMHEHSAWKCFCLFVFCGTVHLNSCAFRTCILSRVTLFSAKIRKQVITVDSIFPYLSGLLLLLFFCVNWAYAYAHRGIVNIVCVCCVYSAVSLHHRNLLWTDLMATKYAHLFLFAFIALLSPSPTFPLLFSADTFSLFFRIHSPMRTRREWFIVVGSSRTMAICE